MSTRDSSLFSLDEILKRHRVLESANQIDECKTCKRLTDKQLRNDYNFCSPFLVVHFEQNKNNANLYDFNPDSVFLDQLYYSCQLIITFDPNMNHYLCFKRSLDQKHWFKIDSLKTSYTKEKILINDLTNIAMILLKKV